MQKTFILLIKIQYFLIMSASSAQWILTMLKKQTYKSGMAIFCFSINLFFLSAVRAEPPAWQTVEGGRIRISIAPTVTDEGKDKPIYGIIELELEPDWKTYWSNPGNSGMAPDIVLEQTAKTEILFPAPQLLQDDGEWSFGYKKHVSLPFRITELQPEMMSQYLSGYLLIGICKTVCVPEQIHFQFNLDEKPDSQTQRRVKAALSTLPKPAKGNFQIKDVTATEDSLHVVLQHPASTAAPQLFMDGQDIHLGIADIKKRGPNETLYTVPILSGKEISGKELNYISVLDKQAVSGKASMEQEKPLPKK